MKSVPGISKHILVTLLLVVSSITNILLARKVVKLSATIDALKAESSLKEGTQVPSIIAQDLEKRPVIINYEQSSVPTLLYVFKPSCGWCKKNEASINALVKQNAGKVHPIALSLGEEKLSEYLQNWQPALPVYVNPSPATVATYKLGGTPQTLLIAPDGKVLKVWTGAFTGTIQRQVEDYFKITLPSLNKT